jgi:hypothetical protein
VDVRSAQSLRTAVGHRLVQHLDHGLAQVGGVERLVAHTVDHLALPIHHVVVFEQVLADVEIVGLDALLGSRDRPGDERMLDDLALLDAHALHQARDPLAAEQAHQVVFQREVEA